MSHRLSFRVLVYGELFGGIYPHPKVPDIGNQPIQKGVYYTNGLEFYAFDIEIISTAGLRRWLNYDQCIKVFNQCELFHGKVLARGDLASVYGYKIQQNSTIPELLGMPPLAHNQMEGIVIKHVDNVTLPGRTDRVIFKKKNANFEEVNPPAPQTDYEKKATQWSPWLGWDEE